MAEALPVQQGAFTPQAFAYELTISLPVPPARAWSAFTLDLDHWWTYRLRDRTRCVIEGFVGGRWLQEWDNGGALFGHCTVWDPPHVLTVSGPLAMTRPAHNLLEFTFEPVGTGTELHIRHQAYGDFDPDTGEMYANGWHELIGLSLRDYIMRRG